MSGGVDSSVSALLLKQQGYDVEGIFMKNWEEDDTDAYCAAEKDVQDAQAVCDSIGIKLHTINFAQEYWDRVFADFLHAYKLGVTPNPDILCNKEIKFKLCLNYVLDVLGADFFATGHYAQRRENNLLKAADLNKDQTYFLYAISRTVLPTLIFPIGHLEKSAVRKIALEANLINYSKKDSTGICFIGERKFKTFLSGYLPAQKGNIETPEGKILGQHDGLMYYTLGQRQGIQIGGQRGGTGQPFYVAQKDIQRNVLVVVQGCDHPLLYKNSCVFESVNWLSSLEFPLKCKAKIRYRQTEQSCEVTTTDGIRYTAIFDVPQWAVTPGQSIVLYQGNQCLGGGIILE